MTCSAMNSGSSEVTFLAQYLLPSRTSLISLNFWAATECPRSMSISSEGLRGSAWKGMLAMLVVFIDLEEQMVGS